MLVPSDISDESHCQQIIQHAVDELGELYILVNSAAFQMAHESLQGMSTEELDRTFQTVVRP